MRHKIRKTTNDRCYKLVLVKYAIKNYWSKIPS